MTPQTSPTEPAARRIEQAGVEDNRGRLSMNGPIGPGLGAPEQPATGSAAHGSTVLTHPTPIELPPGFARPFGTQPPSHRQESQPPFPSLASSARPAFHGFGQPSLRGSFSFSFGNASAPDAAADVQQTTPAQLAGEPQRSARGDGTTNMFRGVSSGSEPRRAGPSLRNAEVVTASTHDARSLAAPKYYAHHHVDSAAARLQSTESAVPETQALQSQAAPTRPQIRSPVIRTSTPDQRPYVPYPNVGYTGDMLHYEDHRHERNEARGHNSSSYPDYFYGREHGAFDERARLNQSFGDPEVKFEETDARNPLAINPERLAMIYEMEVDSPRPNRVAARQAARDSRDNGTEGLHCDRCANHHDTQDCRAVQCPQCHCYHLESVNCFQAGEHRVAREAAIATDPGRQQPTSQPASRRGRQLARTSHQNQQHQRNPNKIELPPTKRTKIGSEKTSGGPQNGNAKKEKKKKRCAKCSAIHPRSGKNTCAAPQCSNCTSFHFPGITCDEASSDRKSREAIAANGALKRSERQKRKSGKKLLPNVADNGGGQCSRCASIHGKNGKGACRAPFCDRCGFFHINNVTCHEAKALRARRDAASTGVIGQQGHSSLQDGNEADSEADSDSSGESENESDKPSHAEMPQTSRYPHRQEPRDQHCDVVVSEVVRVVYDNEGRRGISDLLRDHLSIRDNLSINDNWQNHLAFRPSTNPFARPGPVAASLEQPVQPQRRERMLGRRKRGAVNQPLDRNVGPSSNGKRKRGDEDDSDRNGQGRGKKAKGSDRRHSMP